MKKLSLFLIVSLLSTVITGCKIQYVEEETTTEENIVETVSEATLEDISINFWYYDESYTTYLKACEKDYEAANKNIDVKLVLAEEAGYMDALVRNTMSEDDAIDLYMIDNDALEQASLAGITKENTMSDIFSKYNYSEKAISACTYKDELVAYPLSYNTLFLLYNKMYIAENIPANFAAIKAYADTFEDSVGTVRSIFSCDLNEVFYNYGFLGGVLEIGGTDGDDKTKQFKVTDKVMEAVEEYKNLIAFFSIDIESVDFYSCVNDFENGRTIYTVADVEMLNRINNDIAEKSLPLDYGVLPFLDYNDNCATSPLSVTTSVAVNPFSKNIEIAESFAKYVTFTNASELMKMTGYPACRNLDNMSEYEQQMYYSYDKSTPKLKIMYSDEFYALLEVTMHLMANDEDDVQALSAVSGYLEEQWSE